MTEEKMKPGVFTQMYIHLVFSPKYRERLIRKEIQSEVFSYISGIITNRKHKSIIINGMPDHIHILVGANPNWFKGKFHWQDGYGAFSYGKSQLETIYNYIANQEAHHKKRNFREEYMALLKKFDIKYDDKYLFEFFE